MRVDVLFRLVCRLLLYLVLYRLVGVLYGGGERGVGIVEGGEAGVYRILFRFGGLAVGYGGIDSVGQVRHSRIEAVLCYVEQRLVRAGQVGVGIKCAVSGIHPLLGVVHRVEVRSDCLCLRLGDDAVLESTVYVVVQAVHALLSLVGVLLCVAGGLVGFVRCHLGVVGIPFQLVLYRLAGCLASLVERCARRVERRILGVYILLLGNGGFPVRYGGVHRVYQCVSRREHCPFGVGKPHLCRTFKVRVVIKLVVCRFG